MVVHNAKLGECNPLVAQDSIKYQLHHGLTTGGSKTL